MSGRRRGVVCVVAVALLGLAGTALAQFTFNTFRSSFRPLENIPYDGKFTFVRLNYTTVSGGYWYRGLPAWAHGYPISERNLMQIMNEVSYLHPHVKEINSLAPDAAELSKYPIAYVIEPDWWEMTDEEALALRAYLQKGGFLIVDDFKVRFYGAGGFELFRRNMERIIPGGRLVELDDDEPVFHSFFEIKDVRNFPQAYISGRPVFLGMYEDNDPQKRLMVIVNYNTDISQYWEWSGQGLRPFDETNEAYKLAVNYIIYGMTH